MDTIIIVTLSILTIVSLVEGHGYMTVPANRASRWRFGFTGPKEYTDNQLFCGGATLQWQTHGGKCGVCGDEYGVPPIFAFPGPFAKDLPIVKTYDEGQQIAVKVHITANHKGYFTFRVAPLVNPPIKQDDLDKNVLKRPNGDTKWPLTTADGTGDFTISLELPLGLSCQHCVLQWWYTTGNNYRGINPETFVNCADIKIIPKNGPPAPPMTSPPMTSPPMTSSPLPQPKPPVSTTCPPCNCPQPVVCPKPKPCPTRKTTGSGGCKAVPGSTATDQWCIDNCALGFCPPSHCKDCN